MDSSKNSQGLVDGVSPSKITDYFPNSKSKARGTRKHARTKDLPISRSSIYLTPESSPGTDPNLDSAREDEITCNKDVASDQDSCFNSAGTKEISTDKVTISENVPLSDMSDSSKSESISYLCNSSVEVLPCKIQNVSTEKAISKHEITQSEHAKTTTAKGKKSAIVTSPNESTAISPSVPRPKIRRETKSKPKSDAAATAQNEPIRPKPGRRKKKEQEPIQKNVITDFFPVRRSGRMTQSEIEKEKHHHLEQLILSQCENGLQVAEIDCKGRGVITTKDFLKGDFIVEYAGELLDVNAAKQREKDYAANTQIGCYMYFFSHGTKQYCVDATVESGRLGRLINHSREGNCCTKTFMVQDKPRLILVASRNIMRGEELSYDYGDRSKAALEAHPWLKS